MKERVRRLPLWKCFINPGWEDIGVAHILISRQRADGLYVVTRFAVDVDCSGLKETAYSVDVSEESLKELLEQERVDRGLEEVSYNEVHNLIYGAIEYFEEEGIEQEETLGLARYALEEDSEDIPYIHYEFGRGIKHPDVYAPDYEYCYRYPEYPSELDVVHSEVSEQLLSAENMNGLSDEVIDALLAIPTQELAKDLSSIIYYKIGTTYREINADIIGAPTDSAILHAVMLLAAIKSRAGVPALLELLRQNKEFIAYHLPFNILEYALYGSLGTRLEELEQYLYQPGPESDIRAIALHTLEIIRRKHPSRRGMITSLFRRLLNSLPGRVASLDACDSLFAARVIETLITIGATELMPEIKSLYDSGVVDPCISGTLADVEEAIHDDCAEGGTLHLPFDIHGEYSQMRALLSDGGLLTEAETGENKKSEEGEEKRGEEGAN